MAAMIFYQIWLGREAEALAFSPQKLNLFISHKSIGLTVLFLVILRLAFRVRAGVPPHLGNPSVIERRAADLGHWLLYSLMIAVPLSGWVISDTSRIPFKLYKTIPVPDLMAADKGLSETAAAVHDALTTALMAVLLVHVLAALRHHFLLKNATLKRMLPW